jgi:hypothetical protein
MSERLTNEQLRREMQRIERDNDLLALRARVAELEAALEWRRVNDEPFEYAIRQGPHGDEFIKTTDGACLRRAAL